MSDTIFMFPGVGSHYSGMGKYFYDNFKVAREAFEEASDTLCLDFVDLCFSMEKGEELNKLDNSQTSLVCISTAIYRVFMEEIGIKPAYCMGYSLGELSALCCAGALEYSTALKAVKERGLIINEVSSVVDGTMAWVINLNPGIVEDICKEISGESDPVYVSAYDSTEKSSISGTTSAIKKACDLVIQRGGIAIPIKMSGPFHSPLMLTARKEFEKVLRQYDYKQPHYAVIANRSAKPYRGKEDIIDNLSNQLIEPIRWQESVQYILDKGITKAIEIGPKNVLKYLMEKNTDKITSYAFEKEKDLIVIKDSLFVKEEEVLGIVGRCLGSVASTKNYNKDSDSYIENVVKPYEKMQKLYERIQQGKIEGRIQTAKETLEMLYSVLKAKMLSDYELEYQMKKVLRGKYMLDA